MVALPTIILPVQKKSYSTIIVLIKSIRGIQPILAALFDMNEHTVLYLSAMYQKQGPASEFLLGGAAGFIMNPGHSEYVRSTIFYLGGWYRYGDAVTPYVGFEWSRMKIGFSYDVTLSSAQNMTSGQGAYELSLIYNGMINKISRKKYNFACPKF